MKIQDIIAFLIIMSLLICRRRFPAPLPPHIEEEDPE